MIRLKLVLKSMLSLPVVKETSEHYVIVFCMLAYFAVMFMVLKTLKFNRDRFEE